MTPTVLPHFPSTGPTLMSCPCWHTRSAFPVPTASFCPFGTPEARLLYQHISYFIWYTRSASPVPTASFCPFGTPEARFLYQHISYSIWYTRSALPVPTHLLFHLVHQKYIPAPTHLLFHLVHQKYASCTNAPLYIRWIQRPPHVHFLFYGTIGDPFFQV